MRFKMRTLHNPEEGNARKLAIEIANSQKVIHQRVDCIPITFPCEAEKLIFIGVEIKGSKVNKAVLDFCKDLKPERARNAAFYAIGSNFTDFYRLGSNFGAISELRRIVEGSGVAVVGNTLQLCVKSGLFNKPVLSPGDIKKTVDWAEAIVDSLS